MQFFSRTCDFPFFQTPLTAAFRPLGSCTCLRPVFTVKLVVFSFDMSSTLYLSIWLCN
jgi:hypothetical protein